MSTPQSLAVQAQVPEYLQKYVYDKPNMKQVGKLDSSDIGINMLKVTQSNSKEVKRPGWGITGQEPQLPMGTMFLSRDGKIVTPGTPFIPLLRSVKYIKWKGKQPGEGMDFMTDDENDARIQRIDGLAFLKDPQTGDTIAPLVTKYVSFYIMVAGCELPVLMSFKRTSMPEGRWLTQNCVMGTGGNMMPFFTLCFKFNIPKTIRDGSNDWWALSMAPNGKTPPEVCEKAERMARMAEALNELVTGEALEGEMPTANVATEVAGVQHDVYNAGPVTINGTATAVAPQAPAAPQQPVQQQQTAFVTPPAAPPAAPQQAAPAAANAPAGMW